MRISLIFFLKKILPFGNRFGHGHNMYNGDIFKIIKKKEVKMHCLVFAAIIYKFFEGLMKKKKEEKFLSNTHTLSNELNVSIHFVKSSLLHFGLNNFKL